MALPDAAMRGLPGAAPGSEIHDSLPSDIRPYAHSYWPLAGLVGGGVIVLVVISLLVGNLLQGKGFGAILTPSATATATIIVAVSTPPPASTATPTTGVTAPSSKGKPTSTPAPSIHDTPTAVSTAGASTPTATPAPVFVTAVDCGGGASGQYLADTDVAGGNVYTTGAAVDTSGVSDPAPQSVYQSERWGNFSYTLPSLTPGTTYIVRLHFAEIYWDSANQRLFNVTINGQQVLTNFDIFATAGGSNKALVEQFATTADAQGQIAIAFINGARDNAKCSGIELFQG